MSHSHVKYQERAPPRVRSACLRTKARVASVAPRTEDGTRELQLTVHGPSCDMPHWVTHRYRDHRDRDRYNRLGFRFTRNSQTRIWPCYS